MDYKNNFIEILIIISSLILIFISSDPIIYSDSNRYLSGSLQDPPLYSLLILIFKSIFKSLNSIIVIQTFFISFGIIFFIKTISKYFEIDSLVKLIVAVFLFLPILEFYNNLLTEAFGYAFTLFFISFVIRLIYNFTISNSIGIIIFSILLLLLRKQFIFLYPLIVFLYIGIILIQNTKKKNLIIIISFLSILILHNSIITFNKLIKKESFEKKTLTHQNSSIFNFIYVDAIYISDKTNEDLFEDPDLRKTIRQILLELDVQKANIRHYNGRGHFGQSFPIIINVSEIYLENLAQKKNIGITNLKKSIAIELIKINFKKYVRFLFKKFYDSTWLFVFLPFFMMLAALINFIRRKSNFSLFIITLSIFALANHSLIYLFGRVQPRYLIYSDFILLIFIFLFISMFLKKGNN